MSGERVNRLRKRVLFIQQYFYPDISAVSQLLGDLILELDRSGDYMLTVLCSSVARPSGTPLPRQISNVAIKRVPVPGSKRAGLIVTVLQTAIFHLGVLVFLWLSRGFDVMVTMTSPPAYRLYCRTCSQVQADQARLLHRGPVPGASVRFPRRETVGRCEKIEHFQPNYAAKG